MKRVYTTAQGKQISIDSLRIANEETIAVGNMKVNARGEQLGPGGVPEKSRQEAINEYYNLHTPTVGAGNGVIERPQKVAPTIVPDPDPVADPIIAEQDAMEIEKPAMRGSLASSVAKTAVVNQELLKPAKQQTKDNGPTRI